MGSLVDVLERMHSYVPAEDWSKIATHVTRTSRSVPYWAPEIHVLQLQTFLHELAVLVPYRNDPWQQRMNDELLAYLSRQSVPQGSVTTPQPSRSAEGHLEDGGLARARGGG